MLYGKFVLPIQQIDKFSIGCMDKTFAFIQHIENLYICFMDKLHICNIDKHISYYREKVHNESIDMP